MIPILGLCLTLAVVHGFPNAVFRSNERIVGGVEVDIEEFPYQVALLFFGDQMCGGSIYDNYHVVTAGHCVYNNVEQSVISTSRVKIRAGSSYANRGGQVVPVQNIVLHPEYKVHPHSGVPINDVAVLRLKEPLQFNKSASPIKLAEAGAVIADGLLANTSGWGVTSMSKGSEKLRYVQVPIVNHQKCVEVYPQFEIDETMICAGYDEGGKDSCQGDSGGPLAIDGILYGIVSFGEGCAEPMKPGVYASVPYLRKFIDKAVNGNM